MSECNKIGVLIVDATVRLMLISTPNIFAVQRSEPQQILSKTFSKIDYGIWTVYQMYF